MKNGNSLIDSMAIDQTIHNVMGKLRILSGFTNVMAETNESLEYEIDNHAILDHLETIIKTLSELQTKLNDQRDTLINSRLNLN